MEYNIVTMKCELGKKKSKQGSQNALSHAPYTTYH